MNQRDQQRSAEQNECTQNGAFQGILAHRRHVRSKPVDSRHTTAIAALSTVAVAVITRHHARMSARAGMWSGPSQV